MRGKNGQGKTTILDSFEILLKGAKHIEDDMITHDRKKAEIIGTIGNYEIKRVITSKSTRLEVKHKAGDALAKPQEFLDKLINELTFNPRPFLNKTSEQKLRFMMDFLSVDFTAVDGKIKDAEEERVITGRLIKKYGDLKPVAKADRVSVSELLQTRDKWTTFNREQEELKNQITYRDTLIEGHKEKIENLKEIILDLEAEVESLGEPMPVIDLVTINQQIENAEETNLAADAFNRYAVQKKEKAGEERKYEDYTTRLEKLRNMKKMIFRNAKIPIEGLEIREDGVYHNSIHSENWSEAEGLRISSELCLAMDPKLRALLLDKGENYDTESLKELEAWALENDLQIFITIVDSTQDTIGRGIFYIEEGELV